jgi:multimeric flavodoxin WrbA
MNILVLSRSPQKGGNTDLMVNAFVKGTSENHHVEYDEKYELVYC